MSTPRKLGARPKAPTLRGYVLPCRAIELTPKAYRYLLIESLNRIARTWEKP
jgi:hypothetical protein